MTLLQLSEYDPATIGGWDRTSRIEEFIRRHPQWKRNAARTHTSPARILRDFAVIPPSRRGHFTGELMTVRGELNHDHLEWRRNLLAECLTHAPDTPSVVGGSPTDGEEPVSAFRGLWSLTSHAMPLSLPPLHQATKTEQFARPVHGRLYAELLNRFFTDSPFVSVTHPAGGTTSVPEWSSLPERKAELVHNLLRHLPRIRDLIGAGDWRQADREFEVLNETFLQTRRQAEDPAKERPIVSWSFLQGRAEMTNADKTIDGAPDFGRCRLRLVYALNAAINWPFNTYQFYPFLRNFLSRYEFTYKPRGPEDMSRRVQWGRLVSVDVAQFDNNTPAFLIGEFFERFAGRAGQEWALPCALSLYSPFVAPPVTPQGELLALGHPYEGSLPLARGIPSGHAANVPLGRLIGTFTQIVPLLDSGIVDIKDLDALLLGDHPRVKIMNSSDDAAYSFADEGSRQALVQYLESEEHPYFEVAPEPYFQYLGHVAVQRHPHAAVSLKMRASSYLINMLSPERSTQGQLRRYPWTGFAAREDLYRQHGTAQVHAMQACLAKAIRERTGLAWQELLSSEAAAEAQSLSTWADRVAAANPDAIHYLIDENDLSPLARERLGWTIDADLLAKHYGHINPSRSN